MLKKEFIIKGVVVLLLGVVIFGVYGPAQYAAFQFDDNMTIVESTSIKDLRNIAAIWWADPSRFLTHLSFAVNYHFAGLKTFSYHWVNFFLHFFVSLLVFLLLSRLFRFYKEEFTSAKHMSLAAFFAALIFLFHPIQTSAVTYVSQRSILLASLCYLLCLLFYLLYRQENRLRFYLLALAAAFLGLFTKPIIITLPFALILGEIFFLNSLQRNYKKIALGLLPFFLMIVIVPSLLMLWKYKSFDLSRLLDVTRETLTISRKDYLLTQFNVLMTYFRLLILPINQNLDYDYPITRSLFNAHTIFSLGVIILTFVWAVKMFKTKRLMSFGLCWFFLTLSLESSIFPIADVIFEHRLYLPMIGFAVVVAIGFQKLVKNLSFYIIGMFCLVIVFSYMTYQRNMVWVDDIGFLVDVVKKSPRKARVHNNLAVVYHQKNDLVHAEAEYKKAISLDSHYAHPHNNLGNIYFERGKVSEAIEELETALKIKPQYCGPYYNLGNVYKQQGKIKEAEEHYQRALGIEPTFAPAYTGLGGIYLERQDLKNAKFYFDQAIRLNPDFAFGYYSLAGVYLSEEDYSAAFSYYQKAIEKDPQLVNGYNNLGNICDMFGRYEEAIGYYQKAIEKNQKFANAYFNMANTLRKLGQTKESQRTLETALSLYQSQENRFMTDFAQERLRSLNVN